MSKENGERVAALAGMLANPLRLAIVRRLTMGGCLVGELVAFTGVPQAVVSKQLAVLRGCGLLLCRPEGRCREYSLAHKEAVTAAIGALEALVDRTQLALKKCDNNVDE